jgi:hypothetical protein
MRNQKGGIALTLGRQRRGNFRNVVTPFVGHNDTPNIAGPPLQGGCYPLGFAPSGIVIAQNVASLVLDQLAAFQVEKIPRHGVGHLSATLSDT